jgi:hypothetical protein
MTTTHDRGAQSSARRRAAALALVVFAAACSGTSDDTTGPESTESTATTAIESTASTTATVPAQDYAAVVLDAGPVAYWPLDELTATAAVDAGPNGVDGEYRGVDGLSPGELPAVIGSGSSLRLEGTTGFVHIAEAGTDEATILAPIEAFSIEAWFRPTRLDADPGEPTYLARWRWYGWGLYRSGDQVAADVWEIPTGASGEESPVLTRLRSGDLTTDRWHHLVVTKDDESVQLYVDGVVVARQPSQGDLFAPVVDPADDCCGIGGAVALGRDGDIDGNYLDGWLDEVAVYARSLDADEIARHASFARD